MTLYIRKAWGENIQQSHQLCFHFLCQHRPKQALCFYFCNFKRINDKVLIQPHITTVMSENCTKYHPSIFYCERGAGPERQHFKQEHLNFLFSMWTLMCSRHLWGLTSHARLTWDQRLETTSIFSCWLGKSFTFRRHHQDTLNQLQLSCQATKRRCDFSFHLVVNKSLSVMNEVFL